MTQPPVQASVGVPADPRVPLHHTIAGGSLAWIAFKNAVLTLLTLGIWSFWGKTRVRRYLWANVQIDGDPLHYTGTGFELFKGAIIALLVLAGFFAALYIVGLAGFPAVAGAAQGFALLFLTPVALFFARRYRLSRTEWRGIRAGFAGDLKLFLRRTVQLSLLSALTLGLADPVRQVYVERYFWNNSYFGTARFACDLTVGKIGKLYWVGWALAVGSVLVFVYGLLTAAGGDFSRVVDTRNLPEEESILVAAHMVGLVAGIGLSIAVLLLYRAQFLRATLNGLTLDGVRVASAFTLWKAFKVGAGALFMVALPGGLLLGVLAFLTSLLSGPLALAPTILLPFLLVGVGAALWARYWTARVAIALVETTALTGSFEAGRVGQSPLARPDRGEGLLNAVDFGV